MWNKINIDETDVINRYKNGQSSFKIAKHYNCSVSPILRVLRSNNIERRNRSQCRRRYKLNENCLETIDSEIKAYFLGWLYSDGNVYIKSKRYTISLQLNHEDSEILYLFNNFLYDNKKPIELRKATIKRTKTKTYICKPCSRLQIDSKKMVEDLIKLGCIPNKSKRLQFPSYEIVPKNLFKHFLRGYFEGDGCITNNRKKWHTVSFYSSDSFCAEFKKFLQSELNIAASIYKPLLKNGSSLSFRKKEDILNFFKYCYQDCSFKLNRKYKKFMLIKA